MQESLEDNMATETDWKNRKKEDPYKNSFFAPFDLFGVSAKFYIDGRNRTLTWIGCFCSTLLVGTIFTLLVYNLSWHINKRDSIITTFETEVEGNQFFDMQAGNQVLAIQYQHLYLPNNPFLTYVDFKVTHVTENSKKSITESTPLTWLPCEQTSYYKESTQMKGNSICI